MQTPKLFEVLERLSKSQLRRFAAFVQSPYFNTRDDVRVFLDAILLSWKPGEAVPDRQTLEALCPAAGAVSHGADKQLGYLLSWSLNLVERFLVQQDRESQPWEDAIVLMRRYDQWQLNKHYRSAEKNALREAGKQRFEDPQRHWHQYRQALAQDQHFNRQRKHEHDDSLSNAVQALDLFYMTEKLRLSCEQANRTNWVSESHEAGILDELLAYMKRVPHDDLPLLAMYRHTLLSMTSEKHADHFERLRDLLGRHSGKLENPHTRDLYGYAINYCIKRVNSGAQEYMVQLFRLYRGALEEGILEQGGHLSPWAFKNIVSVACRSGHGAWAETFVQEYKNRLDPTLRANAIAYNQGYIHWHFGRYAQALQKLQEVSFDDLYYALDSRSILIKCFYERNESAALEAALEAFRLYLQRNRHIAQDLKKTYANFVAAVRSLSKIRKGDRAALKRLTERLQTDRRLADRGWIEEKIGALE